MATVAQKVKVGVFLVVGGVILAVGLFVIAGVHGAATKTYYVEFRESVSGLNSGSAVQYLGVEVGKVEDVVVAEDKVRVKISVRQDKGVRLLKGSRATLAMQGISGIVFVQLTPGPDKHALELPEGATIIADPSLLEDIGQSVTQILKDFRATLPQLNAVLADLQNGNPDTELGKTVISMRTMLEKANKRMDELGATLESISAVANSANAKVQEFDTKKIAADIHDALASIKDLSDQLSKTADALNKAVPATQRDFAFTHQQLQATMEEMRRTLEALEQLAKSLEEDPSSLLHGKSRRPEE
jgi:phospholipid/cholesterol/gamma-HCH transport system substrate-binding protein